MQISPESPLFTIGEEINSRLKTRKLSFNKNYGQPKDLEEAKQNFSETMKRNHGMTALTFSHYCMPSLQETFLTSEKIKAVDNVDHLSLIILSGGLLQGIIEFEEPDPHREKLYHEEISEMFTPIELEVIGNHTKDSLIQFSENVKETDKWIYEHQKSKKEQMDPLMEAVKILQRSKGGVSQADRKELGALAPKLMNTIELGSHSIWRIQQLQKVGIPATPVENLIQVIDRICVYLNILHYGNCINLGDEHAGPEKIKFYIPGIK